jgi:hypothetical protein
MSTREPSAPQPRASGSTPVKRPAELSSRDLRQAIAWRQETRRELRQTPGAGQRAWWRSRELDGLLAEQRRRQERRELRRAQTEAGTVAPREEHRAQEVRAAFDRGVEAALARGTVLGDVLASGLRNVFDELGGADEEVPQEDLAELPLDISWRWGPNTWWVAEALLLTRCQKGFTERLHRTMADVFDDVETLASWHADDEGADHPAGIDLVRWRDDVYVYEWDRGADPLLLFEVTWSHRADDPAGRRAAFERLLDGALSDAYGRTDVGLSADFPTDLLPGLRREGWPPSLADRWDELCAGLAPVDVVGWARAIASAYGVPPVDAQRALERFRDEEDTVAETEVEEAVAWWLYERRFVSRIPVDRP